MAVMYLIMYAYVSICLCIRKMSKSIIQGQNDELELFCNYKVIALPIRLYVC
jgi:hypothetical protein